MENYISPSIDIFTIEIESYFATSDNDNGFNVPDGEDNGNEFWG